ncbi:MAG: hypothetical protein HYZ34_07175 [Ignavibacteriae bacterium]|nr:hypothetical protein [Ignavibacteriota bacterium]
MYGEERMVNCLTSGLNVESGLQIQTMLNSVNEFVGSFEQMDDISIIYVRRK